MKWVKECQKNDSCTIFLRDSHKVDENMHIQIENGSSTAEELLQSLHRDADDWVMFHLIHSVEVAKYHNTADIDVFVCAFHLFKELMFFWFEWILVYKWCKWFSYCSAHSQCSISLECWCSWYLPNLTRYDTTSKMGTKAAALEATIECGYEPLCFFGTTEITNEIIVHM